MDNDDEAPCFDEVLGGQRMIVPPVVQHWVDSLHQTRTGTVSASSVSSAAAGVAKCYQLYVRPALLVSNAQQHPFRHASHPKNGPPVWIKEMTVPVLVHYELLLAQLILAEGASSASAAADTTGMEERPNEKEKEANNKDDGDYLMSRSILALTRDIQSLVANVAMTNKKSPTNTQNMDE
eukprot:scaffold471913_cov153-Attheya_sp.AAC.1